MPQIFRKKDMLTLAAGGSALAGTLPAEAVTSSPQFQAALTAFPGAPWFCAGLFLASWLFLPVEGEPRAKAAIDRLFHKFDVEFATIGRFENTVNKSELQLRVQIRFCKRGHFKLLLRVHQLVGQGRKPREAVIDLGEINAIEGQVKTIQVLTTAFGYPGWGHTVPYGWGPERDPSLIGKSRNVASIECVGRYHTQRFRMAVEHINHDVGERIFLPSLAMVREDDQIFDTSGQSLLGDWRP